MGKKAIKIVGQEETKEKEAAKNFKPKVEEKPSENKTEVKSAEVNQEKKPKETKEKKQKVRGKKYQNAKAKIDRNKLYPINEAIALVKETSFAKFGGSLEVHINVKEIRDFGEVKIPYFSGKAKKVAVADEKIIAEIAKGEITFDILLASPKIMPKLLPFAKILGPKGLMPNPKNGTLLDEPEKALNKFSENTLKIKTEKKAPIVHLVVGKLSQPDKELAANLEAILKAFGPGQITKAFLKATMGPSVKIKV